MLSCRCGLNGTIGMFTNQYLTNIVCFNHSTTYDPKCLNVELVPSVDRRAAFLIPFEKQCPEPLCKPLFLILRVWLPGFGKLWARVPDQWHIQSGQNMLNDILDIQHHQDTFALKYVLRGHELWEHEVWVYEIWKHGISVIIKVYGWIILRRCYFVEVYISNIFLTVWSTW